MLCSLEAAVATRLDRIKDSFEGVASFKLEAGVGRVQDFVFVQRSEVHELLWSFEVVELSGL